MALLNWGILCMSVTWIKGRDAALISSLLSTATEMPGLNSFIYTINRIITMDNNSHFSSNLVYRIHSSIKVVGMLIINCRYYIKIAFNLYLNLSHISVFPAGRMFFSRNTIFLAENSLCFSWRIITKIVNSLSIYYRLIMYLISLVIESIIIQ